MIQTLKPVEYSAQRIMTTEQLAEFYECDAHNITKNFNENKTHFVEGKHYFKLEGEELKVLRVENCDLKISPMTRTLYLWTRRGALRHAKILNNDRAWDVFELLEENYFFGNFFEKFNESLQKTSNPILCCVYILEMDNGTVKIGYTRNFTKRAIVLSSASGLKITNWCHSEYVLNSEARKVETLCHEFFSTKRTIGEYFQISFKEACEQLSRYLNIAGTMYLN